MNRSFIKRVERDVLDPSRVVLVVIIIVTAPISLSHGLRGSIRAFEFCTRVFEFYMSNLLDSLNIGIVQRLF